MQKCPPDVWEFALDLPQGQGLASARWLIQNCFSYLFGPNTMLKLAVLWITLCVAAGSFFLDVLFSLSGSRILQLFFVLFFSVMSIWSFSFLCLLRTNLSYLRILSVSPMEICNFSVAEDFPMHLPFPHIPSAVTELLTFFSFLFFFPFPLCCTSQMP